MSARDEILERLRKRHRDIPHPAPWRSRRSFEDQVLRFTEALREVGGEALRVNDLTMFQQMLDQLFDRLSPSKIIVNPDTPLHYIDFPSRWPHIEWFIVNSEISAQDIRTFAAQADIGLSGALAGLAETGTIVIASGSSHSRLATLLPPTHIVILPIASLTTDLFTWTQGLSGPMPSDIVWITGPSKTADIEQTLATGVHGPGHLIAILIDHITNGA